MDAGQQSWAMIAASLWLGMSLLVGMGVAFSRATNIERPLMVGLATVLGAVLGMVVLRMAFLQGGPFNWMQVAVICALPWLFFFGSRLFDRMIGDRKLDPERDEKTYGAHLSD
jgi:hypothetical protein